MKLNKLALLPLVASTVFGTAALANDITFIGQVMDNTCIPSVNGKGRDSVVTLPIVNQALFPSQGDTTGEKSFTIDLSSCNDPAGTKVKAYFWQAQANNAGRLTGSGSGKGWTYELLPESRSAALKVGTSTSAFTPNGNDAGVDVSTGTGKLTYFVRYYNETGSLTSGTLDATATYVLYNN